MDETEKLLKALTEATGVAGYEAEIRSVIRQYFQSFGELISDKIGSLICRKSGDAAEPRIALAGHMDEIGFMVKHITKEGFIRFIIGPAKRAYFPDQTLGNDAVE